MTKRQRLISAIEAGGFNVLSIDTVPLCDEYPIKILRLVVESYCNILIFPDILSVFAIRKIDFEKRRIVLLGDPLPAYDMLSSVGFPEERV